MKDITKIFLCLIVVLAFFLRVFKLDSVPPSLSWDEASAGYNAYTIANYGRDEWGVFMPLVFTAFKVDANPVWIYATAVTTKVLGLSEFSTRLPAALFGVFNTVLLFYLAKFIFKNEIFGLLAALSFSISPLNLQFSRGEWEANYALFFFLVGVYFFLRGVLDKSINHQQKIFYLVVSYGSFGLDLLTYPAAKIVAPLILFLLNLLYLKELWRDKKAFGFGLVAFGLFALIIVLNPRLTGQARASQNQISEDVIHKTDLYKKTHSYLLGEVDFVFTQYKLHFTPKFLFESGSDNPKLSVQKIGELYWLDLPFILLGLLFLIKLRSRISLVILAWLLLAPIPSSIAPEAPHAHRAMFLMGSTQLLIALGLGSTLLLIKQFNLRKVAVTIYLIGLLIPVYNFLNYYFNQYGVDRAIDWQYGMKQIVEYVKAHPEYDQVFMTDVRAQPYIFFLYYLKTPLSDFRDSVIYNTHGSEGQSLVDSFGKYHFSDWNPIDCRPDPAILCITTPSEYDGLRYKSDLKVKELVKYPDGGPAFYIVSAR